MLPILMLTLGFTDAFMWALEVDHGNKERWKQAQDAPLQSDLEATETGDW